MNMIHVIIKYSPFLPTVIDKKKRFLLLPKHRLGILFQTGFLAVQYLRCHLPVQGIEVQSLAGELGLPW